MRRLPLAEKLRRNRERHLKWSSDKKEHLRIYHREYARKYRAENRDKIKAKRRLTYSQEWKNLTPEQRRCANDRIRLWRNKNLEHCRAKARDHYWKHHARIRERQKHKTPTEREAHRKYHRQWSANARRTDINLRLRVSLRGRFRMAFQNSSGKKTDSVLKLLGCSIPDFRIYIESKFDVGMSWENYGRGHDKWHLDHIVPCAIFDLTNPEHQSRCFHFSNYQPLWEPQNLSKGAKFTEQFAP